MVVLSVALVVVALVALSAFGLVLVLARRLRDLTERVNMFLPISMGTLPRPGTPVEEFSATSLDGQRISLADFAGVERIFAMLSTGCGDCDKEAVAFREMRAELPLPPIVAVVGPPEDRPALVTQLVGHAVVLEENDLGPIATAFSISEFPCVMLVNDGHIQVAEHRLARVLPSLTVAAQG